MAAPLRDFEIFERIHAWCPCFGSSVKALNEFQARYVTVQSLVVQRRMSTELHSTGTRRYTSLADSCGDNKLLSWDKASDFNTQSSTRASTGTLVIKVGLNLFDPFSYSQCTGVRVRRDRQNYATCILPGGIAAGCHPTFSSKCGCSFGKREPLTLHRKHLQICSRFRAETSSSRR